MSRNMQCAARCPVYLRIEAEGLCTRSDRTSRSSYDCVSAEFLAVRSDESKLQKQEMAIEEQ